MKKLVALLVVLGLFVGVAGTFAAEAVVAKKAVAKKKVVAKKAVAKKKVVAKKAVAKPVKRVLPKAAPVPPAPPPPPPVGRVPPAAPVVAKPAAVAGLFGLGWNTDVSLGYLANKSVMVARADLILDDPLGLGSIVGLGANAVKYRIGLGGANGSDANSRTMKAIPLFAEGVINLPAGMMGGLQSYIGGGLNYVVYGNESKAGNYGVQAFLGVKGNIGLGGNSFAEVGYQVLRSGSTIKYSAKGVSLTVGQSIVL